MVQAMARDIRVALRSVAADQMGDDPRRGERRGPSKAVQLGWARRARTGTPAVGDLFDRHVSASPRQNLAVEAWTKRVRHAPSKRGRSGFNRFGTAIVQARARSCKGWPWEDFIKQHSLQPAPGRCASQAWRIQAQFRGHRK